MILKVRDEQDFNISMNLNINYELEYIELTTPGRRRRLRQAASQKRWPTTASRRHFCLAQESRHEVLYSAACQQGIRNQMRKGRRS